MNPIQETRKLTSEEVSQVRAILGSVQWRVYQTAPQHAAKLNYLQSLIATQDSSIVEQVNKLIREVYASRSLSVQVQPLGADDPELLCLVGWSDASLANRPDLSSTGGHIIGFMHQKAIDSGLGRVNPVSWRSGKLHRVARSSLSAEAQSLADTEQELFYARLEWREMIGDYIDTAKPEEFTAKVTSYSWWMRRPCLTHCPRVCLWLVRRTSTRALNFWPSANIWKRNAPTFCGAILITCWLMD